MGDPGTFDNLMTRIRAGDQAAAAELVSHYEREVRLEVRIWLRRHNARLGRVLDSADICQSVLASFFLQATVGAYDVNNPRQLLALLVGIARKKFLHHIRHEHQARRDLRRVQSLEVGSPAEPAAPDDNPVNLVARRDLLAAFRRRLSSEEQTLADFRSRGVSWTEIAQALGGTPEGRRKQLARAVKRIADELDLEDGL